MLYVTTRSDRDAFTVSRALNETAGPDGGQFVPFRLMPMEPDRINALLEMGFAHCVADMLNLFFSTKLTGWDVDFSVGKSLCKTAVMNHRIAVAELWHNQQWDFDWVISRLCARVKDVSPVCETTNSWICLAVRIAAVFGTFSELHRNGILEEGQTLDVAVPADDFSQAVAVWYARFMGLRIGTILCVSSEYTNSWDLFNYGQMRTDAVAPDLERLIYLTLGHEEASRFASCCDCGKTFALEPEKTEQLRSGIFSAVVGRERINSIIPRVYRTNEYLLAPLSALAYGGIQDYRAKTGDVRPTLILAEKSPARCADAVARAMGISVQQLKSRFSLD